MLYRIAKIETTEEATTWLTYWGVILGVAVMAWMVFISHCLRSSPCLRSFSLILSLVCRPCHIPHDASLVSFASPRCAACSVAAREQLQQPALTSQRWAICAGLSQR